MTSLRPCWWTKTKDLSLAPFVCPPEVVHFSIVIDVPRGWLKTSYNTYPLVYLFGLNVRDPDPPKIKSCLSGR